MKKVIQNGMCGNAVVSQQKMRVVTKLEGTIPIEGWVDIFKPLLSTNDKRYLLTQRLPFQY
jgi:hypothetical protein